MFILFGDAGCLTTKLQLERALANTIRKGSWEKQLCRKWGRGKAKKPWPVGWMGRGGGGRLGKVAGLVGAQPVDGLELERSLRIGEERTIDKDALPHGRMERQDRSEARGGSGGGLDRTLGPKLQ